MPSCLKCGAPLAVNEEGVAPVLCDRCAGVATGKARRSLALSALGAPVTALLLAINVTVFIVMVVSSGSFAGFRGDTLIQWGANFGPYTIGGEYWRLLSAAFVHANPIHIAVNAWGLWSLGQLCERLFGKWQTLTIYVLTGVGGSLLSIAYNHQRLSVGASGAIFGIIGALVAGLKFGDLGLSHGQRRAMFSSLVSVAMINFVIGLSGGIDNMCHLGGFVTGLMIGLPLGAFARKSPLLQLGAVVVMAVVLAGAGQELVQSNGTEAQKAAAGIALSLKDYPRAASFLERYTAANPNDDSALVSLGELYVLSNEPGKASAAFQRALTVNPNSEEAREALQELRGNTPPPK
jgi:membrane associated rhomboid family serine protease